MIFTCLPLDSIADEITDALKCRSVSEASYSVQENVITEWPGHANIEIVFTNTGDEPIFNWNYSFEFIYNIESPYNCTVLEHEGDLYTVGNSGWNKDIYPGESVTIGFTASSNDGSDIEFMPSFYLLNNAKTILPEGSLSVEYVEYSDWTSGSSGAIVLTNNTEESIKSWEISFAANRPITDAYNVTLITNEDGTYTITGDSYSEIPAGGTYQFGIQCGEHDSGIPFEITGLTVCSSTLALGLTDDQNGNGIPDVAETDYTGIVPTVTPNITDTPAPTTTEEPTVTVEPTITETPTDTPEPTPTEFVFTPDQDLDGDGLYTSEEEMYGTDPNNPDTDGDGVSDGNEVNMMYFPTVADSDYNGVLDGDEDYDGDGIINRDEETYGTCPYAADSDYDGINDYDEIFTYSTDPYEEDSDGDYILDGDELALGLDPTTDMTESVQDNENTEDYSFATTSEQIVEYNTDDQPFSFSFDITAAGRVDKYIKVQETGYKYAIEDNSTILGRSPEIVYDYAMKVDSVTAKFTMKNGYEADIDRYCIFYYWEGYNMLIPIETEYDYDNGTVYATNSMIGTYCLVDTEQMYDILGVEETTESSTSFASDYPVYNMLSSTDTTDINYSTSSVYEFNGHEYVLIVADTPLSYLDAVEVCAKEGGYPAVITSDEENGFLYDLRGGLFASCWLGGLVIREGNNRPTVQWITGEECVYDCWAVLYSGGVEGTLIQGLIYQMNGWAWVDLETATERRVICERPIGTNPDEEGFTISALTFGEEDIELNCYSDSDIDGDGLLDYQELSILDLGTFDEATGAYTRATVGDYCDIAETKGICVSKGVRNVIKNLMISSFRSDVHLADKDNDAFTDNEDAIPFKENEDLIVILACYSGDSCKAEAKALKNKYESYGLNCDIYFFNGYNSFIEKWSEIGTYKKYATMPITMLPIEWFSFPSEFSYYYVTDVVLISHSISSGLGFALGNDEYLITDVTDEAEMIIRDDPVKCYFVEDIDTCRVFESLDMLICDSAIQQNACEYNSKNLAETFLNQFPSIQEIYAFDCFCCLFGSDLIWCGDITLVEIYKEENEDDLSDINKMDLQEFRGALINRYYDSIDGIYGQVLYKRNGQSYIFEPDLYYGKKDIVFEWYVPVTKSDLENGIYMYVKYADPIGAEDKFYFDPVLNRYF